MRKTYIVSIALLLSLIAVRSADATCSVTYTFSNGTTADATQINQDFSDVLTCTNNSLTTRQVLTSGSSATYTTPAGARQLRIRMVGGGAGGFSINGGTEGGDGGSASFNSIVAA